MKGAPIAIGRLERFVADWEAGDEKVPALRAAASLRQERCCCGLRSRRAHLRCRPGQEWATRSPSSRPCTRAEGVLVYGIPEFRLPKGIVRSEIEYVKSLGAELELDSVVGKQVQIDELLKGGYDAVFLGIGARSTTISQCPRRTPERHLLCQ